MRFADSFLNAESCAVAATTSAFFPSTAAVFWNRFYWAPGVLLSAIILLSALGSRGDLDGHEVLVAQTAREMLADGDWVTPHFAGEVRLQKPPLAYWLAAASYRLTGRIDKAVARLPFALAMLAETALVGWLAASWFGSSVGCWAAIAQATTAWAVFFGKMSLVDSVLVLLATSAIAFAANDRLSAARVLSFWGVLGLMGLAKGPVGLALILPPIMAHRLLRSRDVKVDALLLRPSGFVGLIMTAVVGLAWPAAILARHPGAYDLWYGQSVARFLEHFGPNTRPWFYYLYQLPLWTLPWTPFWILAIFPRRNRRPGADDDVAMGRPMGLLLLWLGWGVLVLSLSEGKREHYLLPCLPPCSILAAVGLQSWTAQSQARLRFAFGAALAAASMFWVHDVWIRPTTATHWQTRALFDRQRSTLHQAPGVIQYGNNERWPIFHLNSPMRWPRTPDELARELASDESRLTLAPRGRLEELRGRFEWEVIDEVGPERSRAESGDKNDLVLVRMHRR